MCGIAGIWGPENRGKTAMPVLLRSMAHRGPDDEGIWICPTSEGTSLILGARRLAILDPSPAGRQPMRDPANGLAVVLNGEIYNFQELRTQWPAEVWQSRSDTEALLKGFSRWQHGLWNRLYGMYAVAIYDVQRGRLILARDPLGIKPLYYGWGENGIFFFCSELRPLIRSGLATGGLDRAVLASCLAYGASCEPLTLWRNVRMLGAGEWMELACEKGRVTVKGQDRFWQWPVPSSFGGSRQDAVAALRCAFDRAIQRHLLSDVPVGLFLSGGMDSAALAELCRRNGLAPRAWTLYLEGVGGHDEREPATATARRCGLAHEVITLAPNELAVLWERYMKSLDQPTVDGFNTWLMARAARQQGYKVTLSGLGGDEMFGGYAGVRRLRPLLFLNRMLSFVPDAVRRGIVNSAALRFPPVQREKWQTLLNVPHQAADLCLLRRLLFGPEALRRLGFGDILWALNPLGLPLESDTSAGEHARDLSALIGVLDMRYYMRNILLRDADVMGMAHSVEIRVPLLDREVAELVLSMPGAWRRPTGRVNKPLLAEATDLPEAARCRPKTGFDLPFADWLRTIWRDRMEAGLTRLSRRGILDADGIAWVRKEFERPGGNGWWSRIWMLLVVNEWLEHRANDG